MTPARSKIVDAYCKRTPGSARLFEQARSVFPSGVTHDGRYLAPHPVYVERAEGSRKWDVDENEYVDYAGGHGALLLGHSHPAVTDAVREQLMLGTHYGSCHELEIEWGRRVQEMVTLRRAGALYLIWHRSDAVGDSVGSRAHGPLETTSLRQSLSWLARPGFPSAPRRGSTRRRRAACCRSWPSRRWSSRRVTKRQLVVHSTTTRHRGGDCRADRRELGTGADLARLFESAARVDDCARRLSSSSTR